MCCKKLIDPFPFWIGEPFRPGVDFNQFVEVTCRFARQAIEGEFLQRRNPVSIGIGFAHWFDLA